MFIILAFPYFTKGTHSKQSNLIFIIILIFRMKYWSCCQHKTSDFDQFLKQKECAKGDHKWASAKVITNIG